MSKPLEMALARQLRVELGMPIRQIAAELGVSPGTVSVWVQDIPITPAQSAQNQTRSQESRNRAWRERNRDLRRGFQEQGRERARKGDPLHLAGCMLYWAEGSKGRNTLIFANSDPAMVRFFRDFLGRSLGVLDERMTIRLNVYLGNGRGLEQIEARWLTQLSLPRGSLRKHTINHFPTSTSGRNWNHLPYGVCTLKVLRSTPVLQHIYGAIQEYAGFDQPRWLDGLY